MAFKEKIRGIPFKVKAIKRNGNMKMCN